MQRSISVHAYGKWETASMRNARSYSKKVKHDSNLPTFSRTSSSIDRSCAPVPYLFILLRREIYFRIEKWKFKKIKKIAFIQITWKVIAERCLAVWLRGWSGKAVGADNEEENEREGCWLPWGRSSKQKLRPQPEVSGRSLLLGMLRRLSRLLNEECSLSLSYEASGIGSGYAWYIRWSCRVSVLRSAITFFLFIFSWLDNQRDEYVDAISCR